MRFAGWELIVILIIVVLVFGVGRISKLGADLGAGIRSFRKNLSGDDEPEDQDKKS
ncbi:MAG: twin-arginine translocase TatA/TatE family subunit [Anaerolineales bacterium]